MSEPANKGWGSEGVNGKFQQLPAPLRLDQFLLPRKESQPRVLGPMIPFPASPRMRIYVRRLGQLLLASVLSCAAWGQPTYESYDVVTLAGNGSVGSSNGTGTSARFSSPGGLAVDSAGNVFVADTNNEMIRKITPQGVVSTFAGLAGTPGAADGMGPAARFAGPSGVAIDAADNVYVVERTNHTVRKITPTGTVTTLAGLAGNPGSADGAGAAARFNQPGGITVDSAGTIYVTDTTNNTVRKITPTGVVTTFVGTAGFSGNTDATGTAARFSSPNGLSVDRNGNVYVADANTSIIRKVTSAGVVSTIAGVVDQTGANDGLGSAGRFYHPYGIAVDSSGTVFVADTSNNTIRKIGTDGATKTVAGSPSSLPGNFNGPGSIARLSAPKGIAVGPNGRLYVADSNNHSVRMSSPAGTLLAVNDYFVNRTGLAGNSVTANGNNSTATAETGEPTHFDAAANHSVWWKWTATNFGQLTVSTVGSSFDTVVAIYSGASVDHLQSIGGDDEFGGKGTSLTTIFVVPGVTYAIAVDGYDGATGDISLKLDFKASSEIYSTNFDNFPLGLNSALGYDGWIGSNFTDGVVAVVSDPPNGNAVRLGLRPTQDDTIAFWRPLNVDVVAAGTPVVEFTSDVTITDSTNGKRDNFYFLIYSTAGNLLGGLNFDNTTQHLYRFDGTAFTRVGSFAVGTRYPMKCTINFAKNEWSVSFGSTTIFTNQPLNATGKALTLGDIDGFWEITTTGSPGDNSMTIDNYRVSLPGSTPNILASPVDLVVGVGRSLYLTVTAEGAGLSYQWYKNGATIPGATGASYTVLGATFADGGTYTVRVSNSERFIFTQPAFVNVTTTTDVGRLINLSVRTHAGSGSGVLLAGVVIGGAGTSGTKPVLIRAAGPTLANYGVPGALVNPALEFIDQNSSTVFAANDDWQGNAQVTTVGGQVGAFPFVSASSKDAALAIAPGGGRYAVRILGGTGTASDITLAEVYDATPAASYSLATPRLVNVSARAQVDTGDGILICGFVIGGSTARTVMIRGIGPTLTGYGVGGALGDPTLLLYQRVNGVDTLVASNDDWNLAPNAGVMAATAAQVGAFSLASGTKDSVLLLTLSPGIYSAQLSGVNGTTGVGLVEVYEVP